MLGKIPEIFKNRRQIWDGLRNKLIKKEHVEQVYEARMEICRGCRLYDTTGDGCAIPGTAPCCNKNLTDILDGKEVNGCGCSLGLKARSLSSSCPLEKWKAIMTEKDENLLKSQLNDQA